ncbi:MAG: hypothetical protein ABWZ79_17535 [Pedobacter agri]|uniref:Uncharacterized protein n=1 Tax=Pedobacter agri TaxID=454586 RepID=A0A9X3DAC1_9SPHI|nr:MULTISPECIES: hypothetical protein [Pedobacter]AZI25694.1 hypothetical protein EA772_10175 [Pedobacter sp. G11]MCX3263822.1 hypothetical protein [Pedobacter agri]
MKVLKAILAGFAGAAALNILHETVRRFDADAPRVDLLGEEALTRSMNSLNLEAPTGDNLYAATLAGDIISNGIYYSAIGMAGSKNIYLKGAVAGLTAGLGAIKLPDQMGLDDKPVTKTDKTKVLTVAWYLIGGLVTAAVFDQLNKR